MPLERGAAWLRAEPLFAFSSHDDEGVRRDALWSLGYFRDPRVESRLAECLLDHANAEHALESLLRCSGPAATLDHVMRHADHLAPSLADMLRYEPGDEAVRVLRGLCGASDDATREAALAALEDD